MPVAAESLWLADTTPGPRPALTTDDRCEIAVLGGGIAGVTTAYLLAERGVDVVLVEAATVGSGTTGHTTGKVSAAHGSCYAPLTRKHGAGAAAAYARLNIEAMRFIDEVRDAEQIECDWRRREAYTYTVDPDMLENLRSEADAARQAGVRCEFVTDLPLNFAEGAVRTPDQAEFHAVKWVRGLAEAAERRGARIFENSRVLGVSAGEPCIVRCAHGRLVADRVVVATHFPILDRGLYFARMSAQRSYCVALRPKGVLPEGMFISVDSPTRSVRTHPLSGGTELLIVGGQGHKAGQEDSAAERYETLVTWAREHFAVDSVAYRWSAQDPVPPDHLPYVGNLRPGSDRILVATGFVKWGLTNGTAAAQILAGLLTGAPHADGEVFDSNRFDPIAAGPTLIKENANVARRMVGDRLARAGDPQDIAPGSGAIVRRGIRRVAAFRDEDGDLHEFSAACTHLGCEVRFNDAERSWDCPCHGSRFDAVDGRVLEGPAVRDLHPRRLPEGATGHADAMSTASPSRPLAVVTGASSGIGYELARQFVDNGYDLVAVAEDPDIATVAELGSNGAHVDALQLDLASDAGVDELYRYLADAGRPVDALALNAGIGAGGGFATEPRTSLDQELQIIDLNVRSVVHLAKHVVADMVERDEGRVLFTSSIASTMPGAFQAVYNASKSFVQSFALALRNELKDTGVTITSLMPGPVDTEFFERADMLDTSVGASEKDDPADVARQGFNALMAGDERVVAASLSSKVQGKVGRVLPDSVKAEMHRKLAEPGSAKDD